MSISESHRFRASRRVFLKAGVAGGAALFAVHRLHASGKADARPTAASRPIFTAIVPVLLDGALPSGDELPSARAQTLDAIDEAIAGLPPAAREELAELFSLLNFAPTRFLLAGVWSPWSEAPTESVAAFLARWRDSRWTLLRSAYGALHQIVFAAWYAQPRAWPATGYSGPPWIPAA